MPQKIKALFLYFSILVSLVFFFKKDTKTVFLKEKLCHVKAYVLNSHKAIFSYSSRLNLTYSSCKDMDKDIYVFSKTPLEKDSLILGKIYVERKDNKNIFVLKEFEVLSKNKSFSFSDLFYKAFEKTVDNDWSLSIGKTVLFGKSYKDISPDVLVSFTVSSLIFLLIVSGIHIHIIFNFFKALTPTLRIYRLLPLIAISFYVFFILDLNPPSLRAYFYILISELLELFYRRGFPFVSLIVSTILTLIYFKEFSLSLELSFLITLFILLSFYNIKAFNLRDKVSLSFLIAFVGTFVSSLIISNFSSFNLTAFLFIPFLILLFDIYINIGVISFLSFFKLGFLSFVLNKIGYFIVYFVNSLPTFPFMFTLDRISLYILVISYGILLFYSKNTKEKWLVSVFMLFIALLTDIIEKRGL